MLPHTQDNFKHQPTFDDHIEVLDVIHLEGRSAVKATCRVRIGRIAISGIKVILPTLASRPFVGMPSRKNGLAWEPIINILSPTLQESVSNAVLAEWRRGAK
jgi:hypothetical protein